MCRVWLACSFTSFKEVSFVFYKHITVTSLGYARLVLSVTFYRWRNWHLEHIRGSSYKYTGHMFYIWNSNSHLLSPSAFFPKPHSEHSIGHIYVKIIESGSHRKLRRKELANEIESGNDMLMCLFTTETLWGEEKGMHFRSSLWGKTSVS